MNITALHTELTTDPLSLGYSALITAGNDQGVADVINAKNYTLAGYALISDIQAYVDSHGLRDGIESNTTSNPAARAASRLFVARYATVDVNATAFDSALAGLVSSSLITVNDKTAIQALGVVPASRAEVLWGVGTVITIDQISLALRGT